jgi:hypothetical protein
MPLSCVNQEIKVFNTKLGKYMKSFDHASSVEVKFDRKHYTRHGLHLNKKGKELATNWLVTVIKGTFVKNKRIPISVIWKEGQEVKLYKNTDKEKEKDNNNKVMDLLKQSDQKSTGLVNLKEEQKMEDTTKYGNKVGSNWLEDEQVEIPGEELQIGNTLNRPQVKRSRRPPSKGREDFYGKLWEIKKLKSVTLQYTKPKQ